MNSSGLSALLPAPKSTAQVEDGEDRREKRERKVVVKKEEKESTVPTGVYDQHALVVPQERDEDGNIKYEVLARVGQPEGRQIKASLRDALAVVERHKEKHKGAVPFYPMPAKTEIEEEIRATRAFIASLINVGPLGKQRQDSVSGGGNVEYVKFKDQGDETRVVRIAQAVVDPLEPPRFKHKKAPRPPPSPPAPVLHSPPRKPSQAAYQAWRVPACVSGWKNPKGYTIPLDKRMVNDPREALPVQVSEAFADVSQALYVAEKAAREQIERRSEEERGKDRERMMEKQEHLRKLAMNVQRKRPAEIVNEHQRVASATYEVKYDGGEKEQVDTSEYKSGMSLASGLLDDESTGAVHYDRPLFSATHGRGLTSFHRVTLEEETHGAKSSELSKLMRQADAVASGHSSYAVKRKQEKEGGEEVYGRLLDRRVELTEPELLNKPIAAASKKRTLQPQDEQQQHIQTEDVFGLDAFLSQARKSSDRK